MRIKVLLPLFVLILANGWLFGGIWWNRSGAATGEITFDQCHFYGPASHHLQKEGRYFTLRIASPAILDGEMMADTAGYGRRKRVRAAYLLIEQGGPAWEEYFTHQTEKYSETKRVTGSNTLVFADSAEKAADLKVPDPGSTGHAIINGYVRIYENGQGEEYYFRGIARPRIAIDSDYRDIFKEIYARGNPKGVAASPASCEPEYRITLRFGARFEPWISRVERL
ncbi:MAG: hypothetical protein WDZ54_12615 [Sneathiella sp.]